MTPEDLIAEVESMQDGNRHDACMVIFLAEEPRGELGRVNGRLMLQGEAAGIVALAKVRIEAADEGEGPLQPAPEEGP